MYMYAVHLTIVYFLFRLALRFKRLTKAKYLPVNIVAGYTIVMFIRVRTDFIHKVDKEKQIYIQYRNTNKNTSTAIVASH